jgi:hypothetical protein
MQVHLDYLVKLLRSKQKEDPEKNYEKSFLLWLCCEDRA